MRLVTYKSLVHGVAKRLGIDPESNLAPNQASTITEYINGRLRLAWEFLDWPEITRVDCLTVEAANCIKLDHAAVFGVFSENPQFVSNPKQVPFCLDGTKIRLLDDTSKAQVYLKYRLPVPAVTSSPWSASVPYDVASDPVYLSTNGQCYKALKSNINQNPVETEGFWELVEIPYTFAEYIKCGAFSDALREDGQFDKALAEEVRAESFLIKEADKVWFQQKQQPTYEVMTK